MRNNPVFVPGKVLLSGEHTVVYGKPALVTSIDKGITVTIRSNRGFELVSDNEDGLGLVPYALELIGVEPETVRVTLKSTLPTASGFGSSAALCAGVIKAGADYVRKTLSPKEWFELTWQAEKKAHGNSSGVDPAAAVYGGLLWYVRGKVIEHLTLGKKYELLLVQSGKPIESTGDMVTGLAKRIKLNHLRYKVDKIGEITHKMRLALGHGEDIAMLINQNGYLLEELGLVGNKALELSNTLRDLGCGVKISGAGGVKEGSGVLLVVYPELDKIQELVVGWGFENYKVTI